MTIVTTGAVLLPCSSFLSKPEASSLPLFCSSSAELRLALRASRLLFGIAQKVTKKARHRTRRSDSHRANQTALRFSARRGCSDSTSMYCFAIAAIHRRDPSGFSRPACDARRRERGRFVHEYVHPCTALRESSTSTESVLELLPLLLRQDAARTGPPVARRVGGGKARRVARRMRASSLYAHGCAFSEPRSPLAYSEGRMPGERATGGVFLWLPFFAQAKKVTRSPAGRVEALHFIATRAGRSPCVG
jgi:hypothetical protein